MTTNPVATGMSTAEIKRRWLAFFAERDHTVVPSASLVSDDPTLMFTVAGMVPFVPYLTGMVPAPYTRATSVQKCIRTNDIEEVGRTPRHGTFFQMCGNFSFGDYFKRGAITYAWEFLTLPEQEGGLGFDPNDLWVTVYEDDDEAFNLWREISSLPEERIQRLGKDTNFWSTGQPGPAGPSSEIFFDRGPAYGADGGPATDDDRYVEIWNLVFMQYAIDEVSSKTEFSIRGELPNKNIDTGLGLERVAFIKQGVENIYEIDQIRPVLDLTATLAGRRYGDSPVDDVRMRVVADHVRSGLMLMNDGVTPSNEGRGYILRRLLRRVILSLRLLGLDRPVFDELFTVSYEAMRDAYPELDESIDFIKLTARGEERTFLRTLSTGVQILDNAVAQAKAQGSSLHGDTAFLLHDTHGFPIELTLEIAGEAGVAVDETAFRQLMAEQRERAKQDALAKRGQRADRQVYQDFRALGETRFIGYDDLHGESRVLGIIVDGKPVPVAREGNVAEIILAETTLWPEAGGQDSDQGMITGPSYRLEVLDVQRPIPGLISHTVRVVTGEVAIDDRAETHVDAEYRRGAAQAHSATHIVHAAIRETLGPSAMQTGSYNKAGYMRLDFSHGEALSKDTQTEIEAISNLAIRADYDVITREMPLEEAKAFGALALFTEKYGDSVRVVDIGGPWSRELCAGTHVGSSSEIGLINLVSESSPGASNRRVEALVGFEAFQNFAAERSLVRELTQTLNVPRIDVVRRVQDLTAELKAAERRIQDLLAQQLEQRIPELLKHVHTSNGMNLLTETLEPLSNADELRKLVVHLRDRLQHDAAVIAVASEVNGKPVLMVATTQGARDRGIRAGDLVKVGAKILGGGGGGKPDLAQGGGTDMSKADEAFRAMRDEVLAA